MLEDDLLLRGKFQHWLGNGKTEGGLIMSSPREVHRQPVYDGVIDDVIAAAFGVSKADLKELRLGRYCRIEEDEDEDLAEPMLILETDAADMMPAEDECLGNDRLS